MGVRNKLLVSLSLLLSAFSFVSCSDTDGADNSYTLTPEEECFLFQTNCPVDCLVVCQAGALNCSGNTVEECVVDSQGCGAWLPHEVCSTSCVNGACTAAACPVNCEPNALRCSGSSIQVCSLGADGCYNWVTQETCPKACLNGACAECASPCTEGQKTCFGKTLNECKMVNGCLAWSPVKTCESYCVASTGVCTEDLPSCDITNGSQGKIDRWKDGDTLVVNAFSSDNSCNERKWNAEYKYWQQIRYDIRVHGIDAPECSKEKVTLDSGRYYYYQCKKDTYYNNDNEPYGYESWLGAQSILPKNMIVTITCDNPERGGVCPLDDTDQRYLAYIGYSKNNASYDFSIETARAGNAFSNTNFQSKKRGAICRAQSEAQDARAGVWGTKSSISAVIDSMGKSKRSWLKNMASRCNSAMQ